MSTSALKQIDELISPNNETFESNATRLGDLWSSRHQLHTETSYRTSLPQGLHIGAGFANMHFASPSLGQIQTSGASLQILQCPAGFDEEITTRISSGHGFSGGLYFSHALAAQSEELENIVKKLPADTPLNISRKIPFHIAKRLCSSADDWFQGKALELFMEARAYEYIAVATGLLSSNQFTFERGNKRYAKHARDIIEADLENVPTLTVLARMSATNVRSLTQAFRTNYGCTIQQYVTIRRMEKAVMLLEEGLSVSETAYHVGYSLAYFSEKFRDHFGFNASSVTRIKNSE